MSKSGSFGEFSRQVTEAQLLSDSIAKLTQQERGLSAYLRTLDAVFTLNRRLAYVPFLYTSPTDFRRI